MQHEPARDRHGVWNHTSEAGLKAVRLWERRWEKCPTGKAYVEMNAVYCELSAMLKIDLWTLDEMWLMIRKEKYNMNKIELSNIH